MLKIKENVNAREYTTLAIGGVFRYFVEIENIEDLRQVYIIKEKEPKFKDTPIFILGGGSNIIFPDGIINALVLKIEIKGFKIINEDNNSVDIKVGAGENWDEFVAKTVELNLSGIESLSAIPGTVGATPVQNVGAYGAEVKDVIIEVEVFDIKNKILKKLSNKECNFEYRNSIFKKEAKGKYIITNVVYRLKKSVVNIPNYHDVKKYLIEFNINNPSILDIRNIIINIRKNKLPNPKEIPNVGSFFKNPIIGKDQADKLKKKYIDMKTFDVGGGLVKIPAGWLIENAGLKGVSFGNISVYKKNALVLVNNGHASKDDLMKAKNKIIKIVFDKFGIKLEQEPGML